MFSDFRISIIPRFLYFTHYPLDSSIKTRFSLIFTEACTTNGNDCKPNGECLESDLAANGWFCHCFDGYLADAADDKHSCIEGN